MRPSPLITGSLIPSPKDYTASPPPGANGITLTRTVFEVDYSVGVDDEINSATSHASCSMEKFAQYDFDCHILMPSCPINWTVGAPVIEPLNNRVGSFQACIIIDNHI